MNYVKARPEIMHVIFLEQGYVWLRGAALVEMNTRSLSLTATFQRTIAALAGGGSDTHVPVRGV